MAVEGLHYLYVTGSKGAAPIHVNEFTELEGTDCTESGLCSPQAVCQDHCRMKCATLRSTIHAVVGFPTYSSAEISELYQKLNQESELECIRGQRIQLDT